MLLANIPVYKPDTFLTVKCKIVSIICIDGHVHTYDKNSRGLDITGQIMSTVYPCRRILEDNSIYNEAVESGIYYRLDLTVAEATQLVKQWIS